MIRGNLRNIISKSKVGFEETSESENGNGDMNRIVKIQRIVLPTLRNLRPKRRKLDPLNKEFESVLI